MNQKSIYLIGALQNLLKVQKFGNKIRTLGFDVFDDWSSPGPEADQWWRTYEKGKNHSYKEALNGYACKHIFEFDKFHLDRCDMGLLMMPAGKSGHLELGYLIGQGKPGFILFDKEPKKYDIMVRFATEIFFSQKELLYYLKSLAKSK
jgi:nucleoside 2-deoxyribosyltransferase